MLDHDGIERSCKQVCALVRRDTQMQMLLACAALLLWALLQFRHTGRALRVNRDAAMHHGVMLGHV